MRAVIGLDYGTQAARAVLVDAGNGEVLRSYTVKYPHSAKESGIADAKDYESVLLDLLDNVTPEQHRKDIAGICVDATSLTLVPVAEDGRVISCLPEFENRHHARIKLWKYHGAQAWAEEALALARAMGERFLGRTGGSISCEWTLPKLLQIRDEDLEVYERIDKAMDLCEFLTFRLTGALIRSVGSMCYKGLWSRELGFPGDGYLNGLRPGFAGEYRHRMRGTVLRPGDRAGFLKPKLCRRFGLNENVTVAAGILDGHTAPAALGALEAGDAALVMGTSNVLAIQAGKLCEIEGICGIAPDGLTAGLYGIDAGQNGTGDILEWYIRTALPASVLRKADSRGISPHQLLAEQIRCPWENTVIAADWWNGSRNAPCDLGLLGIMGGLSLNTRPQDIYLALLQSIACGTREILEQCEKYGVEVKRLLLTGGIAEKNPFLMSEYANLLNRTVQVGQVKEGPALGAAVFAAVAAGIYASPREAYEHMGVKEFVSYEPDREHREAYEALYRKNHALRVWAARQGKTGEFAPETTEKQGSSR